MLCPVKITPTERTMDYGFYDIEAFKDLPEKRAECYGTRLLGSIVGFKKPSCRILHYSEKQDSARNPNIAWHNKCGREGYRVTGRGKQWVIVYFGERAQGNLKETFRRLSTSWRDQIGLDSSLTNILGNINYLKIIALGKKAVPLILTELQGAPMPWFTALQAITGENPVDANSAGDFRRMADSWLQWGRERGLINGEAPP
jgi:hypothetical protein